MEPFFKSGQIAIFRKLGTPQRANVVLYSSKSSKINLVGRIIGLPKESIRVENGNIYIDDNANQSRFIEEYLNSNIKNYAQEEKKWMKIGEFEYLILSDNKREGFSISSQTIHKNDIKSILFFKL